MTDERKIGDLVPTNGPAALALAYELGARMDATGLVIDNPNLSYEDWTNIGRAITFVGDAWQWWIGDWLVRGETQWGDDAAAAVDDVATRYDIARRITGASSGRLANIRSTCSRIPKVRRRQELSFDMHAVVQALEPDEQKRWLTDAVSHKWKRDEFRYKVKERNPDAEPPVENGDGGGGPLPAGFVPRGERIEHAARDVVTQAQATGRGTHEVPDEIIARLREAFGGE